MKLPAISVRQEVSSAPIPIIHPSLGARVLRAEILDQSYEEDRARWRQLSREDSEESDSLLGMD